MSESRVTLSPSQIKAAISNTAEDARFADAESRAQQLSLSTERHLQGISDFYRSRRQWSGFLIGCIAVSLLFQMVLTFLVGFKILDFTQYQWFLPIVASENFVQIVGLAIIVLKWLFSGATPNKMLEGRD